jgi:putative spermidine/putrescine transport system substrate-binding protein/spermidine/putrescine transport system substrate-binding protein
MVADVTGYDPANPQSAQLMPDEQKKNLHLDDPDGYMAHIYFWEQVQRRAKYTEVWNEVKAAP